jgi:hypothetical protein
MGVWWEALRAANDGVRGKGGETATSAQPPSLGQAANMFPAHCKLACVGP